MKDITEILSELDAGVFAGKISKALSDTALSVITHGRKGSVVIELKLEQIGESNQVNIAHKIKYDRPTRRGKSMEEDTTETSMHVNPRGVLTIFPINQEDIFKSGERE